MLISYYSANYQQLSPCQSCRWQILPISRLAVSSTGHELLVMETKSLALLTALTDKWGALEKLGPSPWAGEGKKKSLPPSWPFFIHWERRLNTADSVCMVCFQNMRIINGFCWGPFNLLPSCSHRFYLGLFFFFFFALQMVPEKQEQCFILAAKAKEVCGLSLGSSNTTE